MNEYLLLVLGVVEVYFTLNYFSKKIDTSQLVQKGFIKTNIKETIF